MWNGGNGGDADPYVREGVVWSEESKSLRCRWPLTRSAVHSPPVAQATQPRSFGFVSIQWMLQRLGNYPGLRIQEQQCMQ